MKVGDKVKIVLSHGEGHVFEGRTGVVVGFDESPEFPWDVYVDVEGCDLSRVPFYKVELEVIQ